MTSNGKRICIALLAVTSIAAGGGCGYDDENTQAVRVVANSYIRAYASRDPATICRVLVPSLSSTLAVESGASSCEKEVATNLKPTEMGLEVTKVSRSGDNATAYAGTGQSRFITLVKFGSLWRVASSWMLK
jgi:hypothetical protein